MQQSAERRRGNLTERQKRFADYYLESGNARQEAERAGYSPSYASVARHQPAVEQYLRERLDKLDAERIADLEEVLEYLTRVLRGEESEGVRGERGAAARMKAAELLGKRLGLFVDTAPAAEPVVIVDDISGDGAAD